MRVDWPSYSLEQAGAAAVALADEADWSEMINQVTITATFSLGTTDDDLNHAIEHTKDMLLKDLESAGLIGNPKNDGVFTFEIIHIEAGRIK